MEDTKVKALVIGGQDYKDNDRLITLLTPTGKVTVLAKGVKSPKAKLKSCVMPFCFGDFVLAEKNGRYVLTSADIIDTFFDITIDYDRYIVGCKILEIASVICGDEQTPDLLLMSLDVLKNLAYSTINPKVMLIKFLLKLTGLQGFDINLDKCSRCGKVLGGRVYFDFESGEVLCNNCKPYYAQEVPKEVFVNLVNIDNSQGESVNNLSCNDRMLDNILSILIKNFNYKFASHIKNV